MKMEFFFLPLQVVLVVALFFALRAMIRSEASKLQKQKDGGDVISEHLANQALGSFICISVLSSFLLCSLLTWWQIVLSVVVAVMVITVKLRCFKKK